MGYVIICTLIRTVSFPAYIAMTTPPKYITIIIKPPKNVELWKYIKKVLLSYYANLNNTTTIGNADYSRFSAALAMYYDGFTI